MLTPIAAIGEKPSNKKIGGNIAGVTIPNDVHKEPNPIPIKRVCSSLFLAIPFTYSRIFSNAPVSFIKNIRNIVKTTARDIPNALTIPVSVAPIITIHGVLK